MPEKQDIFKEENISMVAHQLREPLTSIRWCSEMLLSGNFGELDKSQKDLAKEIYEGTNRLNKIIDILPNIINSGIENVKKEDIEKKI